MSDDNSKVDGLIASLEDAVARARAERLPKNVPDGWEHVGWIDDHGQLWSLRLRNGTVRSDRPLYAPPARTAEDGASE